MTAVAEVLEVKPGPLPRFLLVGERVRLGFDFLWPQSASGIAQIINIACRDAAVTVDSDLFQRDISLSPGDHYHSTLVVEVAEPKSIALDDFHVEWAEKGQ